MSKTLKRILIAIVALVGAIVIFFLVFFIRVQYNLKSLKPTSTGQVTTEVIAIQDDFSNMYLIRDGDNYIAVDAANNAENVKLELDSLGIATEQIKAVLLTHTDGDHVGALKLFPDAEVYMSTQEEQMLKTTSRMLFIKNKIYHEKYMLIDDGEEITIGNIHVKGILTPGHTKGAMCYQINNKYLFTGDALGLKDKQIVGFNEVFNMDTPEALESMSLVVGLDGVEYILTAHYGFTNNYSFAVSNLK